MISIVVDLSLCPGHPYSHNVLPEIFCAPVAFAYNHAFNLTIYDALKNGTHSSDGYLRPVDLGLFPTPKGEH